jgi:hypothetical protein
MVDEVRFRLVVGDGPEISLVGDLARMVHFARQATENSPISGAVHEEFACSVKVVEGDVVTANILHFPTARLRFRRCW